MAKRIISNFIGYQSRCAVNIPYQMSQEILSKFDKDMVDSSLFDDAQKEIYDLLRASYRRYKLNRESQGSA